MGYTLSMFANLSALDIVYFLIALLISMIIHEVMHGVVAYWLGDETAARMGRLTLNPLKHIDSLTTIALPLILVIFGQPPIFAAKPVPFNPQNLKFDEYGAAIVGAAGPLSNFVLALVGAILLHVVGATSPLVTFIFIFTEINVALMVFNLIPFPPLDGSRILYAFAPEPLQEIMARIESFGFLAILIFIFAFFQILSPFIQGIEGSILNFLLQI